MPRRWWASWWTGNYADEGCTKPPFKVWNSGYRDRASDKPGEDRDECSLCAVIEGEDELVVWNQVKEHFPDFETRFCDAKPDDFVPNGRFK